MRMSCHLPRIQQGADKVHLYKAFVAAQHFGLELLLQFLKETRIWICILLMAYLILDTSGIKSEKNPHGRYIFRVNIFRESLWGKLAEERNSTLNAFKNRLFNRFNMNSIFSINLNSHLSICFNGIVAVFWLLLRWWVKRPSFSLANLIPISNRVAPPTSFQSE